MGIIIPDKYQRRIILEKVTVKNLIIPLFLIKKAGNIPALDGPGSLDQPRTI